MTTLAVGTIAFTRDDTKPATPGAELAVFSRAEKPALRRWPAPWLDDAEQQLLELAMLPEDWDSYGAAPVARHAIMRASQILADLALIPDVETPVIAGTPAGDVSLSWDHGDWSLDASVDADGLISYVFLCRQHSEEQEGRTRDIGELASWLVRM